MVAVLEDEGDFFVAEGFHLGAVFVGVEDAGTEEGDELIGGDVGALERDEGVAVGEASVIEDGGAVEAGVVVDHEGSLFVDLGGDVGETGEDGIALRLEGAGFGRDGDEGGDGESSEEDGNEDGGESLDEEPARAVARDAAESDDAGEKSGEEEEEGKEGDDEADDGLRVGGSRRAEDGEGGGDEDGDGEEDEPGGGAAVKESTRAGGWRGLGYGRRRVHERGCRDGK